MVKPIDARRSLELLLKAGCQPTDGIEPFGALRVRRSINLSVPGMGAKEVDLHWTTLPGCRRGRRRVPARQSSLLGVPTVVPSPTDLLLSVITHGTNWYPQPVRWVLDSSHLLTSVPTEIDWDLFVGHARHHRYAWPVGLALDALEHDYGVSVPPGISPLCWLPRVASAKGPCRRFQRNLPARGVRYPFLLSEWLRARRNRTPGPRAACCRSWKATWRRPASLTWPASYGRMVVTNVRLSPRLLRAKALMARW